MAAKGLIFLDSKSAILYEQLKPRFLENKREPCEITFDDFDEVSFKITCSPDSLNCVTVNMAMACMSQLRSCGSEDILHSIFPGMESAPDAGFDVALTVDCDALGANAQAMLDTISNLKRHMFGGVLSRAFVALAAKKSSSVPLAMINYRASEIMFVCPSATKVTVVFLVDFKDPTDKAMARVFLQEFVEAQRTVRTAPPVSFSRDPPGELTGVKFPFNPEAAGFISFSFEERHVSGSHLESAVTLLTGFRSYLHYHIKCSKTYLHMRMRKRVNGWMQVLNRAVPAVETEKKTAGGKSFVRK